MSNQNSRIQKQKNAGSTFAFGDAERVTVDMTDRDFYSQCSYRGAKSYRARKNKNLTQTLAR